jgi:hypothetical protein
MRRQLIEIDEIYNKLSETLMKQDAEIQYS